MNYGSSNMVLTRCSLSLHINTYFIPSLHCVLSLCLSLGCSTSINNNRVTNQRPSCHHHMQLLTVKPNQPRHPQTNQISHHQRQQNSPEPPPPHHTTPPKTTKPKQLLWYNYIYGFRFITWYTFCLALYH